MALDKNRQWHGWKAESEDEGTDQSDSKDITSRSAAEWLALKAYVRVSIQPQVILSQA